MTEVLFTSIFLTVVFFVNFSAYSESVNKPIRKSSLSGSFYPSNKKDLIKFIDKVLISVESQKSQGNIKAIMVPHAGYIYSAQVAAYAYKQIEGKKFDAVVLLGPAHRYPLEGAAICDNGSFETPLGIVSIDVETAKEIESKNKKISRVEEAFIGENSFETQLPFLQRVLGSDVKVVPILINDTDLVACTRLAEAIVSSTRNKNVLLIASTDLSHYPREEVAVLVDRGVLSAIQTMDANKVLEYIDLQMGKSYPNLGCVLCGEAGVYTTMIAAKLLGATKASVLKYANSATASGDSSSVVGYGAVVFSEDENSGKIDLSNLTNTQKKEMLRIARCAIRNSLDKKNEDLEFSDDMSYQEKVGLFVTLTKNGDLRGCIGHIEPVMSLRDGLVDLARAAAFEDPRFNPVKKEELKNIKIEISILSPLKRVASADDIVLGRDGVIVKRGFNEGVFLPQVADETGWTKEEFLSHLCRDKAGLRPDAWKTKDIELYTFEVVKFSDDE